MRTSPIVGGKAKEHHGPLVLIALNILSHIDHYFNWVERRNAGLYITKDLAGCIAARPSAVVRERVNLLDSQDELRALA